MSIGFLCSMFMLLSVLGCIIYFPFKEHWSKIFSFWDLIWFGCGIMCIGVLIFCGEDMWAEMGLLAIVSYIFMAGIILYGVYTFITCWLCCSNIFEAIMFPLIMVASLGAYMIIICIGSCLFFLGLKQLDEDD